MGAARIPLDEEARLQALGELRLLDGAHETMFDAIARLAASICESPIALISVIDRERQWFVSRIGIDTESTPRDQAFCAHAILAPELLEVGDTFEDERFSNNPLVTGAPHIRFYAGVPLLAHAGSAIGTLCILDRRPRRLSEAQRAALSDLAAMVERLLEARRESLRLQAAARLSEVRLRAIIDHMPAAVAYADTRERLVFANRTFLQSLGVERGQAEGRSLRELLGDGYSAREMQIRSALAGVATSAERVEDGPGGRRNFESRFVPDRGDEGAVRGFYGFTFDVSSRRQIEAALERDHRQLQLIAGHLRAGICHIDRELRYRYVNPAFARWLDRSPQALAGSRLCDVHDDAAFRGMAPLLARALAGERVGFEVTLSGNGASHQVQIDYVPDTDAEGRIAGVFGLITDLSAEKRSEEQLRLATRSDALTGLANRYRLYERLDIAAEIAAREQRLRALLHLDIDRFKPINDRFGHTVGDLVLCEFARRLLACVRGDDTVARLVGDEFVVVLEDFEQPGVPEQIAEQILAAMRAPFELGTVRLEVSASIGIAYAAPGDNDTQAWLRRADEALYAAKAAGRSLWRSSGL